ncbi:MAG: GNAT family N-acetyltransferase [Oculatellaceae cyanobacterium bins.114]|nr:GNAT family N-acetyltransferase [Oculatellaceae cyanobacterium bins.114]
MLIRPATVDDIPAVLPMVTKICALHQEWDNAKYGFLPDPEQRYQPWLIAQTKEPKSVFMVAEDDTPRHPPQLVAFLIATTEAEIPIYQIQEYGFIHDLWVEPDYRHTGIGRLLVKRAIAQFNQMGVQQIRLDVAVANEGAKRLFQSCGFRFSISEMLIELS